MLFHHVCILTDTYEESLMFYKTIFSGCVIRENRNFHGRDFNTWISAANIKIELQTPKRGIEIRENNTMHKGVVHIAFLIDDVAIEYQRLSELGISSFIPKHGKDIYTVNGEKLMKLTAPEGTLIEFRETDIEGG